MISKTIKTGFMLGVAATGLAASPALAQAEEGASAGDIIVTARRVEERLQDVPISMTVVSNEQLANRNITVANDLATYTPGLASNERYGPEKQSFSLRGFNQDQSTAPTVGVYFAEVVGVRAQGGTTSGNSVGAGAFMDLQNVQVLKGPQGTLFGRNTTGGAILLTPHKPTDNLEGYVEGSIGNYGMKRAQAAINIPLAETFKVRAAVDRMKRDGYMKNLSTSGVKAFNDRNYLAARLSIVADLTPDLENYTIFHYSKSDTNGYAARITSCEQNPITDRTNPRFSGTRLMVSQACQVQLGRQNARGDDLYTVESSIQNPFVKITQWQAINTTTWKASDSLTIKNIMSYGEFRESAHFDLYTSNLSIAPGGFDLRNISPQLPFTAAAGTPFQYIQLDSPYPGGHASSESTFTEELQLQGSLGEDKFNYVIGGYLEFARPIGWNAQRTGIFLNCTRPMNLACTNPLFFGSVSESKTQLSFDNHGIFGQGTYKLNDQLSLTAGVRYTFDKISGVTESTRLGFDPGNRNPLSYIDSVTGQRVARQCTDSFRLGNGYVANGNQALCRTELTNKSSKPTWVINADYKFTPDNMVYAKWARGYRQGGLNFTNPGLERWGPESMDTFEVGAKNTFRGAVSGYFNLAVFYNKLRDMQLFGGLTASPAFPGVAGGAAIINAGAARSYGAEVDGSIALLDNALRFDFGYAYLDTKITKIASAAELAAVLVGTPFSALTPTASLGSSFTLTPKHKFTLAGTYTLPLDESVGKFSLGATMAYTGKQIANGSVPAVLGPVGGGALPSRTLVNVNVNWDKVAGTPIDLALFATNVTKKKYAVNTGGGWNSSGIGDVLMGEPRMYGVKLRFNFGQ